MNDRQCWIEVLERVGRPVLENLANRTLRQNMPVKGGRQREVYSHLEAGGRLLAGIAPWLESNEENERPLREEFARLAREAIDAGTDPNSPDYFNYTIGGQPVVDAAFLAHGILRAPNELWEKLDPRVQRNLVEALMITRRITPCFMNWLLFSAIIEALFYKIGEWYDPMRIDYALRQHMQWYVGDGHYSDGPEFHWDYYNSFVIHPMLIDIIETVGHLNSDWEKMRQPILERAKRYAAIQERLISPEGTFPPIGRSLAYRFGAFQLLAQMALREELPVSPAQVRCALTAVIKRTMEAPGTFEGEWLTVGLAGHQPGIGEIYISTGSTYLCATGLLPLGLPANSEFWSAPDEDWTSKKIWSGKDMPCDAAY
ncbi:MAG: DUF2264 domain-containing protein [Firmicutes bacterium]|jgi:hypothetical protein|nr:DUF2264 domain-containing protein [Bacillota bacterium]